MEQKERALDLKTTEGFNYKMEQRLECTTCHKVRYRNESTIGLTLRVPAVASGKTTENGKPDYLPASLEAILKDYFNDDSREFVCPQDKEKTVAKL